MSHDYIAFRNLSTKFQTHFFLENSAFFSKFRSQNFNKKCAQNAGNRISEALDFKIFRGRIPPDPPYLCEVWELCISQPTRWIRPWSRS